MSGKTSSGTRGQGDAEPRSIAGDRRTDESTIAAAPADIEDLDVAVGGIRPGTNVGRYIVLEEIGRGGMGRVLRAYDPKLQREVALKEVRGTALSLTETKRLVAEARAMAKLSHPHVVSIYDVEETADGRVVLVMEYVAGQTLRAWLHGGEHPWSRILERFVAAGEGLAAAHAAGLLHRDFKPANVLVAGAEDDDARVVKVTDFGIAKAQDAAERSVRELASASERAGAKVSVGDTSHQGRTESLTAYGEVVGTPRYMAPEQHRPPPADEDAPNQGLTAAVDQYAFCVALWEALCGKPPFAGDEIAAAKERGPPSWPNPSVPRTIAEAVTRGLAPLPADRWPSMSALLEALAYDSGRTRRRWAWGVGIVAAATVVALGAQSRAESRAERCSGAEAQLSSSWNPQRRARAEQAVTGIGAAYASAVWERTAGTLDEYAADWTTMYTEACEASTVRGEQSTTVMDLRMACLHRARVNLEAAVDVLEDADGDVVRRAHEIVGGLPELSRCADVAALQADVEPPAADEAAAVEKIRAAVVAARTARAAGRYDAAREALDAVRTDLSDVEYEPIHAEVMLAEGLVRQRLGEYEAAEEALRGAIRLASANHQWRRMLEATTQLIFVVGYDQRRTEIGLGYRDFAEGLARGDVLAEAAVANAVAVVLKSQGKYEESEREHRRAIALREEGGEPDSLAVASSRSNLASVLRAQGRYEDAEAEIRQALVVFERTLGPEHPDFAGMLSNLANIMDAQGKHAEAELEHRRVLAVWKKSLGPEHPAIAAALNNIANVLDAQGKHAEAEAEHRRGLALVRKTLGPEHPEVAKALNNLASALYAQNKLEEAEAVQREAVELRQRVLGEEHPLLADSWDNLGFVLRARGKHAEAEAEHRRALALRQNVFAVDHPALAQSWTVLGEALEAQGKYGEARDAYQRALAIQEQALGPDDPRVEEIRRKLEDAQRQAG